MGCCAGDFGCYVEVFAGGGGVFYCLAEFFFVAVDWGWVGLLV